MGLRISPLMRARRALGLLWRLPAASRNAALSRMLETSAMRNARLERVIAMQPDTVLFICHGNIMRSAFAVAYMRLKYPDLGLRVCGAGTHAGSGRPAQHSALRVASEMGVPLDSHRATPLHEAHPGANALLLCMDRANEGNTMAEWPDLAERVFLLGDAMKGDAVSGNDRWVADPYGKGDEATRAAFTRIAELVDRWVALLRA